MTLTFPLRRQRLGHALQRDEQHRAIEREEGGCERAGRRRISSHRLSGVQRANLEETAVRRRRLRHG
eukprot:11744520-Alexandrium_andersonii.AAC.1